MKKALITGITGQDGSYLAEFLLEKGYEVHGIVRRSSFPNTGKIDHIIDKIKLYDGDLSDSSSIIRIVNEVKPDEIYNLAAQSHVGTSFDAAEYTGDVDAIGVLRILEAVRMLGLAKKTRIYQASTSELYGKVEECPQSETTPFHPYSPYAVAKQYGFWMIKEYREAYGMFACNGILFNHESERRGENFVTRKITRAAGRIACGLQDHLELGNLDSLRDWGYAKDYVECMWLILQQDTPDDFVMRNVDLARFDKYQIYYHSWYRNIPGIGLVSWLRQIYHKHREIIQLKQACKYSDKIYTDSNNSMQMIIKYCQPRWIKYYHLASVISKKETKIESQFTDKYALIINSNRNEKNAIRTLIAFCNYKLKFPEDPICLYMVGFTESFESNLKYVKDINYEIVSSSVRTFDYVSSQELNDLFRQCYFLLYPSKSEGYGLPLLDALEAEKPVVASSVTSVPEVLGTAGYYVDPYNTESIEQGIEFMSNPENNKIFKKRVIDSKELVHMRQLMDTDILVKDIVS